MHGPDRPHLPDRGELAAGRGSAGAEHGRFFVHQMNDGRLVTGIGQAHAGDVVLSFGRRLCTLLIALSSSFLVGCLEVAFS